MELRRELLLITMLIIVIATLVKLIEFFQVNVIEADASNFVKEDLRAKYPEVDPDQDIEIMTIIQKTNEDGQKYFEVKARVTLGARTACPERSHIFYNYPAQNFVPQLPEVITSGCKVCESGICTIAFPEEAAIASHTFSGTEEVKSYIAADEGAASVVTESPSSNSWLVKWDSADALSYYVVDIHRNGTILSVKETQKS